MNRTLYRIVFSKARGQWMAVCETATASGRAAASGAGAAPRRARAAIASAITLALAGWMDPAQAAPTGGQVAQGSASVHQSGATTTIQQQSQRAIINWQGFGVGSGETVRFVQPNADAAVLNRVTGALPSRVDGNLLGNGRVFLINPNGIVIGKDGVVNVQGGFVASTQNVSDGAFMGGGAMNFAGGVYGSIQILGKVSAPGGDIVVIAPKTSVAAGAELSAGKAVHLVAASTVTLSNGVITVQPQAGDAGELDMAGAVTAAQARLTAVNHNLGALAINTSGTIRATGTQANPDGSISIVALGQGGNVKVSGTLAAQNADGSGGSIAVQGHDVTLNGATLNVEANGTDRAGGHISLKADAIDGTLMATDSRLSAASREGAGGRVDATGWHTGLDGATRVSVVGATGGGQIRIGGGFQGHDTDLANAQMSYVGADVVLDASASSVAETPAPALQRQPDAKGGQVVVWADDTTRFAGSIDAHGRGHGSGGDSEVSGKQTLFFSPRRIDLSGGDAAAPAGTLLLDPADITISNAPDSVISAASPFESTGGAVSNLNLTTLNNALVAANVTVASGAGAGGNGDITLVDAFTFGGADARVLTLTAARDVNIDATLTATSFNGFGLVFNAARDINVNAATTTTGGLFWSANRDLHVAAPVLAGSSNLDITVDLRAAGGDDFTGNGQLRFSGSGSIATGTGVNNTVSLVSGRNAVNGLRDNSVTLGATPSPGTLALGGGNFTSMDLRGFGTVTFDADVISTNSNPGNQLRVLATDIVINPTVSTLSAWNISLVAGNYTGEWVTAQGTVSLPATLTITAPHDLYIFSGLIGSARRDLTLGAGAVTIDRAPAWAPADSDLAGNISIAGFRDVTLNQSLRAVQYAIIARNLTVNADQTAVDSLTLEAGAYDAGATVTNAYANGNGWTSQDGLLRLNAGTALTAQRFLLQSGVDGSSAATRFGANARIDLPTSVTFTPYSLAAPVGAMGLLGFRDVVLPGSIDDVSGWYRVYARNIDATALTNLVASTRIDWEAGIFANTGTPLINRYTGDLNGQGVLTTSPGLNLQSNAVNFISGIRPDGTRADLGFGSTLQGVMPQWALLTGFDSVVLPTTAMQWPQGFVVQANDIVVNADIAAAWISGTNTPFELNAGRFHPTTGLFDFARHPGTITFNNNPVLATGVYRPVGNVDSGMLYIATGTTPGQSFSGVRLGYVGATPAYSLLAIANFDSTTLQMENAGDVLTLTGVGQPGNNFGLHGLHVNQRPAALGDIVLQNAVVSDSPIILDAGTGGIRSGSTLVTAPTITLAAGANAAVNIDADTLNVTTRGAATTLVVNEANNVLLDNVASTGGNLEVNARGELTLANNIAFGGVASLTLRSDAVTGRTIALGDTSRALVDADLNTVFAGHNRGLTGELGGDGLGAVALRTSGPVLVLPVFRQAVVVEAASFTVPLANTYFDAAGNAYAAGTVLPTGTLLSVATPHRDGYAALPAALDTLTDSGAPIREFGTVAIGGYTVQATDANRYYDVSTGAVFAPGTFLTTATQVLMKPGSANVSIPRGGRWSGSGSAAWVVGGYVTSATEAAPAYTSLGTAASVSNVKDGVVVASGAAPVLAADTAVVDTSIAANHFGNPVAGTNDHLNMSGQFYTLSGSAFIAPTKLNQLANNGGNDSANGLGWDTGFGTGVLQTAAGDLRIFSGAAHAIDGAGAFVAGGAADLNVFTNAAASSFGYASTPADGAVQLITGTGNLVALGYRDVTVSAGGTLTSGGNVTIGAARDLAIDATIAAADDATKLTTLVAGNMIRTGTSVSIGSTGTGNLMLVAGRGVDAQTNVAVLAGSLQDVSGAQGGVLAGGLAPNDAFVVRNVGALTIGGALSNQEVDDLSFAGATGIAYAAGTPLQRSGITTGSVNGTAGFGNIGITTGTTLTLAQDVRTTEANATASLYAGDIVQSNPAARVVAQTIELSAHSGNIGASGAEIRVAGSTAGVAPQVTFTQDGPAGSGVAIIGDASTHFSGKTIANDAGIALRTDTGTLTIADASASGGRFGVSANGSGAITLAATGPSGDIVFAASADSGSGTLTATAGRNLLDAIVGNLGSGTDTSASAQLNLATGGDIVLSAGNSIGSDGVDPPDALEVWRGGSLVSSSGGTGAAAGTFLNLLDTTGNAGLPTPTLSASSGKHIDITSRASTTAGTGDLTIGGLGVTSANGGTIRFAADRHLAIDAPVNADADGNVVIAAGLNPSTGGNVTQGATGTLASFSGEVNVHAAGDVTLGVDLSTGGNVLIQARDGAIVWTGGQITADRAALTAATTIGSAAARITTDVTQLVLSSAGDQFASSNRDVQLAASTSNGRIDVRTANGTITVGEVAVASTLTPVTGLVTTTAGGTGGGSSVGVAANGSGAVRLVANGPASDVVLDRHVTSGSGNIVISAAQDAVFRQNQAQARTGGTVSVSAGRDIVNATAQTTGLGSIDQIDATAAVLAAGRAIGAGVIDNALTGANNTADLNLNVAQLQANAAGGDAVLWNRGSVTLAGDSGAAGYFGLNAGGLIDQAAGARLVATHVEFDTARNIAIGTVALANTGDLSFGQAGASASHGVSGGSVVARAIGGRVIVDTGYTLGVNGDLDASGSALLINGRADVSGQRVLNGVVLSTAGAVVGEVLITGTQARVTAHGTGAGYVLGAAVVNQLIAAGVTDVTIDLGNSRITHSLAGLAAQAIRVDSASNAVSGHWNVRTGRAADAVANLTTRQYHLSDAAGSLDLGAINVTVNAARGSAFAAGTQASTVAATTSSANTAAGFDATQGSDVRFTQTRTSGTWTVRDAYDLRIDSPGDVNAAYVKANHQVALIAGARNGGSLTIEGELRAGGDLIGVGGLDVTLGSAAHIVAGGRIAFVADETAGTAAGAGWFRNRAAAALQSGSNDIAVYAVAGGVTPTGYTPVASQIELGNIAGLTETQPASHWNTAYQTQTGGSTNWAGFAADGAQYLPGAGAYGSPVVWYKTVLAVPAPVPVPTPTPAPTPPVSAANLHEAASLPFMSGGFAIDLGCDAGQNAAGRMLAGNAHRFYGVGTPTFLNQPERRFGAAHGLRNELATPAADCPPPLSLQTSVGARPAPEVTAPIPSSAPAPQPARPAEAIVSVSLAGDLLFAFDASSIDSLLPGGRELLDRLAARLMGERKMLNRVRVTGHADRLGSEAHNAALSLRRAEAVAAYLGRRGVTMPMLAHGAGSSVPVVDCHDASTSALIGCLQPNRRVVVDAVMSPAAGVVSR